MNDFIHRVGVGTLAVAGIAAAVAVGLGLVWLAARIWPGHWSLRGPQRRSADVQRLFRNVNAAGRHVGSCRRLLALGPFTIYMARYRPGNVKEDRRW